MRSSRRGVKILLAAAAAALAVGAAGTLYAGRSEADGAPLEAVVRVDGAVVRTVPLDARSGRVRVPIATPYGMNVVAVDGKGAFVETADCPSRLCVSAGTITRTGQSVACLPHRLLVELRPAR